MIPVAGKGKGKNVPRANLPRCQWCGSDPLYVAYHDREWGVPVHSDLRLFEMLVLEGFQAGLNWLTVLKKRESFRRAFEGLDPERVAEYGPAKIAELMHDSSLIRNRLKIEAAVANARACLRAVEKYGSLDACLWRFTGGRPRTNTWRRPEDVPAWSRESVQMSRELKKDGFVFVGPTICYAFMQAVGIVNDHLVSCFRHGDIAALSAKGR